jgi:hypothetical protein
MLIFETPPYLIATPKNPTPSIPITTHTFVSCEYGRAGLSNLRQEALVTPLRR